MVLLAEASGLEFDDAETAPLAGDRSDTAPLVGNGSHSSAVLMALNLFWLLFGRCTSVKSCVNLTPPGFQPGDGSASSKPGSRTPSEAGLSTGSRLKASWFTLANAAIATFLALMTLSLVVLLLGRRISAESTTSLTPPGYTPGNSGASPRTLGVLPAAAAVPALDADASHLLTAFVSFFTGAMPTASCVARLTAIFFALAAFGFTLAIAAVATSLVLARAPPAPPPLPHTPPANDTAANAAAAAGHATSAAAIHPADTNTAACSKYAAATHPADTTTCPSSLPSSYLSR